MTPKAEIDVENVRTKRVSALSTAGHPGVIDTGLVSGLQPAGCEVGGPCGVFCSGGSDEFAGGRLLSQALGCRGRPRGYRQRRGV